MFFFKTPTHLGWFFPSPIIWKSWEFRLDPIAHLYPNDLDLLAWLRWLEKMTKKHITQMVVFLMVIYHGYRIRKKNHRIKKKQPKDESNVII